MKTKLTNYIKIALIAFALQSSISSIAADYYWVGGSGVWTDLTHWATTSGGATFHNIVPTPLDRVIFDANSFTAPGQTVVINFEAFCDRLEVSNLAFPAVFDFNSNLRATNGIDVDGDITWMQDGEVTVQNGDMTLSGNTVYTMGNYNFLIQNGDLILEDVCDFNTYLSWNTRTFEITNGTMHMSANTTFDYLGNGRFTIGDGDLVVPSGARLDLRAYEKDIKNGSFKALGTSTVNLQWHAMRIYNGGVEIDPTVNYTQNMRFWFYSTSAGGPYYIKSGGNDLRRIELTGTNYGNKYILLDDLTATADGLYMYANEFNSGGKEIDVRRFYSWTGGVVKIDLTGTNTVKVDYEWRAYPSTNTTVNMGTANIVFEDSNNMSFYAGRDVTYNDVHFKNTNSGGTRILIQYAATFNNITVDASGTQYLDFYDTQTVNDFTWNYTANSVTQPDLLLRDSGGKTFNGTFSVNSSGSIRAKLRTQGNNTFNIFDIDGGVDNWEIQGGKTQTITDLKPIIGTCENPILINSNALNSQGTISQASGTVTGDYLQLLDNKATGGATFVTTNTADLGNVTGWTIVPIAPEDFYWIGNNGVWSNPNNWSLSSGGPAGCAVPSRIDNVFFDANSFSAGGQFVNVDEPAECDSMTWSGITPGAGMSGGQLLDIYGSLELDANMNMAYGGTMEFEAIDSNTIETNGVTIPGQMKFVGQNQSTGVWTLIDDLKTNSRLYVNRGTFNSNGNNLDLYGFESTNSAVNFTNGTTLIKVKDWFSARNSTTLNMGVADILFDHSGQMQFRYNYGHSFNNINFNQNSTGGSHIYFRENDNNTIKNVTVNQKGSGWVFWDYNDNNTLEDVTLNHMRNGNTQIYATRNDTYKSFKVLHTYTSGTPRIQHYSNSDGINFGDFEFSSANVDQKPYMTSDRGFTAKSFTLSNIEYIRLHPSYLYTFDDITITGTCNNRTRLYSATGGNQVTIVSNGPATADFAVIKDINATGTGPYTATNSADGGNVTGWSLGGGGNYYWVGGTGNWNDNSHWSLTSGGPSAGCIPSEVDNVFFDVNSFSAPNQTVNVNVPAFARSMVWNNVNNPRLIGNQTLNIYGSMVLAPNLTWNHNGWTYFQAREPGKTITTNGVQMYQVQFLSDGTYDGEWTLQDDLDVRYDLYVQNGSFISNGNEVSARSFFMHNNNAQTSADFTGTEFINVRHRFELRNNPSFNIGSADIKWENMEGGYYRILGYSNTFNDLLFDHDDGANRIYLFNNSNNNVVNNVIVETTAYPQIDFYNNQTYNDISLSFDNNTTNIPTVYFTGSNTMNIFSSTSIGNAGPYLNFQNNNTFNDLVAAGLGTRLLLGANRTQTVNGLLALGNGSFPVFVKSLTDGQQATLFTPEGQICLEFVLLQDIKASANTGTGTNGLAAEFFAGSSSVDLGNNTNWQFTNCVAYYWVGDSGNWSDYANHWATSSGGTFFHVDAPGPDDDVYFDANSFTTNGRVVNVDVANATAQNMTWQSALFTPTFTGNTTISIYGDLKLITLMNQDFTGNWNFEADDAGNILNTSIHSIREANFNGGGEWVVQNSLLVDEDINFNNGTLNTNNKDISAQNFNSTTSNTRSLVLGDSEVTIINGNWNPATLSDTALEEGTSTIFITGDGGTSSFLGNSLEYNDVTFTTTSNLDASLTGTNTFNTLQIDKGLTLTLEPTTQTMTQLIANGSCDEIITIKSADPDTPIPATFSQATGTTDTSFLDLSDNIGTGGATFNADLSVDSGGNSGWNFTSVSNIVVTVETGDVDCELNNDGFAEITNVTGGTAPYNYLWSTTETTARIENLIPGDYSVTVTDASNCAVAYAVAVINEPSEITPSPFTASDIDVCIGTTIDFEAGSPPEPVTSYLWDFGDFSDSTEQNPSHTYAAGGTYTVSLSYLDDFGCPAIVTEKIRVSDLQTDLDVANVDCFGNDNGSIDIEASGGVEPYQYSIDNGTTYATTGSFTNLVPGTYNVIVVDAIQCTTATQTITISQPSSNAEFTFTAVGVSCAENADGTITFSASGGTPPYDYSINNGIAYQSSNTFVDLPFGSYNVVVRDDNNCIVDAQVASIGVEDIELPTITCPANANGAAIDGDCEAEVTVTSPSVNDNCAVESVVNDFNGSDDASGTYPLGTTTVVWTVRDVNGNINTCSMTVTVTDTQAPTAVCKNIVVDLDASGVATITGAELDNGSSDPCGSDLTFSVSPSSFNCDNLGDNTVVLTVTDVNGNSSTCSATVTVRDTAEPTFPEAPTQGACLEDITVNIDTGQCSAVVNYVTPVGIDNCTGAQTVQTEGLASGSQFPVGTTTNTFEVTDAAGLKATCTFRVTVIDNEVTTVVCNDITVELDDSGSYTLTTDDINAIGASSSDACGDVTFSVDITSFSCDDLDGSSSSSAITPTNVGNQTQPTRSHGGGFNPNTNEFWYPQWSGSNSIVYRYDTNHVYQGSFNTGQRLIMQLWMDTDSETDYYTANWSDRNVTKRVSNTTIWTYSIVSAEGAGVSTDGDYVYALGWNQDFISVLDKGTGVYVRQITLPGRARSYGGLVVANGFIYIGGLAENWSNNPNSYNYIHQLDMDGNYIRSTNTGHAIYNMAFDGETMWISPNSSTIFGTKISDGNAYGNSGSGANLVILTVTDSNNNVSTCEATVTVVDKIAPSITCPDDIIVSNDDGLCGAVVTYSVSYDDNCTGETIEQTEGLASGSEFPIGTTTNTFVVTDASGNEATCSFDVTVNDTEHPAFNDTSEIALYSNDFENPNGITQNGPFWDLSLYQTINSLYGADWQNTYTVETILINGPSGTNDGYNIYTDPTGQGGNYSIGMLSTAQDDRLSLTFDTQGKDFLNVSFDLSAIDLTRNGTTGSFGVATPTMRLRLYDSPGGSFNISSPGTPLVTMDLIGVAPSTDGPFTFNWTEVIAGLDASGSTDGNVSLMFDMMNSGYAAFDNLVITASDVSIVGSCPDNISVNNDIGACTAIVEYVTPVGVDNCPNAQTVQTAGLASGSAFPVGTTTNIFVVTDAAGNEATCSFDVTVIDNEKPTITCPANVNINNDEGLCSAVVTYEITSDDNCDVETIEQTEGLASGSAFPVGTTTNTFVVTDAAGNEATCSFDITVTDTEKPTITCPEDITTNTLSGNCLQQVVWDNPIPEDNCDVESVDVTADGVTIVQQSGNTSSGIFPLGTTVVTYTVIDVNGNETTCNFNVTLIDEMKPTISNCPSTITVSTDPGMCDAEVTWPPLFTDDNCTVESFVSTHNSGANFPLGTTTVTYTATDQSNNVATCSFDVIVEDTEPPVITCPTNQVLDADINTCLAEYTIADPISDNCTGATWGYTLSGATTGSVSGIADGTGSGALSFNIGVTTVTLSGRDANSVANSCEFTVTVLAPEIDITGNSITINDGDSTPDAADDTDFGQPNPGVPIAHTFTIDNNGSADLDISSIAMSGPNASNFVISGISAPLTIAASGSATFTVTFAATPIADYNATVNINSNDCDEALYDFAVHAEVTCLPVAIKECQNNIEVNNTLGECGAAVTYTSTFIGDPAPTVSYTFTGATTASGSGTGSGSIFNVGITNVTVNAVNACGNENCSFTVTVIDNEKPIISCPGDVTVECPDDTTSASTGLATATDNCDSNPTITQNDEITEGSCAGNYVITRTWTATDSNNNSSSCVQTITVQDNTPPTINSPANDVTVECDGGGNLGDLQAWLDGNGALPDTSGCFDSNFYWSNVPTASGNTATGTINAIGYTYTSSSTVLTTNSIFNYGAFPSSFGIPNQKVIRNINATSNTLSFDQPIYNPILVFSSIGSNGNYVPIEFSTDVTLLFAQNVVQNSSTKITGNEGYAIVRLDGVYSSISFDYLAYENYVNFAFGADFLVPCPNDTGASASDNCGGVTWTNDFTGLSDDCGNTGSATVIFTATDECGNSSSTTATFTIEDTTDPAITAATDLTVECDGSGNIADRDSWLANNGGATSSDDCSSITWSNDYNFVAACGATGSALVTFTSTDACGRTSSTTATFTIEDTTDPAITAATDLTVECDGNGNIAQLNAWLDSNGGTGAASDDCSGVTWSNNFTVLSDDCGGTTIGGTNVLNPGDLFLDYVDNVEYRQNSPGLPLTFNPTDGNYMGVLLQNGGSSHMMYQDVTMPATGPIMLDFDLQYESHTPFDPINQFLAIEIRDISTNAVLETLFKTLPGDALATPMSHYNFDLSAYDSQTVRLCFINATVNNFYFDILYDAIAIPGSSLVNGSFETGDYTGWNISETSGGSSGTFGIGSRIGSGTVGGTGSATVTFTATDACGLTSTTSATFTIIDTTNPTWDAEPSDMLTVECDPATNADAFTTWLASFSGSDSCGTAEVTHNSTGLSDLCGGTGSETVTFTLTDECDNFITKEATFTIIDTTNPTWDAEPSDMLTVECDPATNADAFTTWLTSFSGSDSCGTAEVTHNSTGLSDLCGGTGSETVIFTLTDECDNFITKEATFTIIDTTNPTWDAEPSDMLTVECDPATNADAFTTWLASFSGSDSCGTAEVTHNSTGIKSACGGTGSETVTFTLTDECDNFITKEATFTIIDTTNPTWDAEPSDMLTVECDPATNADAFTTWLASFSGSDSCGTAEVTHNSTGLSDLCGGTGSETVIFTLTDECDNFITKEATFTIIDTTNPTWDAEPSDMLTVECDPATNADAFTTWLTSFSGSDSCGTAEVTHNSTGLSDLCGGTGSETVTFTLTDECDNFITKEATFTIIDTTNPTWDAEPSDMLTVECDPATNADAFTTWLASFSGSDSCGTAEVTHNSTGLSDLCGGTGSETVTFTLTDECDNFITKEATFTIIDTTNPTWDAEPSDMLTVECDPATNADAFTTWLASFSGSDSCGTAEVTHNSTGIKSACGGTGSETVTFTLTDECDNFITKEATFTIIDTTNPTWDAEPSDMLTVECDPATNADAFTTWLASFSGSDSCGTAEVTHNSTGLSDLCGGTGSETVTFTLTDECDNFITKEATFTIIDTTNPTWDAEPSDMLTVECDPATNADAFTTWLASFSGSDSCGTAEVTHNSTGLSDLCGGTGSETVTFTLTDECDNFITKEATFTIIDTTNPTWDAEPSDMLTVECDPATNADAFTTWLASFSGSDSCGTATVTNNSTGIKDACGTTGSETVTFTLTDECDNFITKEATFTILDTIAPELECPADISTCADQDLVTGAVVSWTVPVPTDICSTVTLVSDHQPGDIFPVGDTTVTYTATDECFNITECSFVITVWELPEIEITESELPPYCQENAKILTANVVSNTGGISYDWSTGETTDNIHVTASGNYSLIVTDANGCTRETSYDVEVIYGDLISAYTILATEEVHLHGDNQVLNGGVGVFDDGEAKIHENTQITGATTFLQATDTDITGTSAVTNTVMAEPNVSLTAFEANPFDSDYDIEVDDGLTLELDEQVYGKIKVKEGATVIFTQKDVFIKELDVEENGTVQFAGCAFVRVEKGIDLDEYAMVNPDNFQVNFYTEDNVDVKKGSVVNASIYALNHEIKVDGKVDAPTYMNGRFIGKKVSGDGYVNWDWNTVCDTDCTPGEIPLNITCECDGGIKELTFSYAGNGADLTTNSGMITDNGDGTYTITNGGEKLEKDLEISNGVVTAEIHTSCSDDILGITFAGEMTVVAYTDMSQNTSTEEACPFLVDQDCECNGGMVELTFSYEGDGSLLATNSGMITDNGDGTYTITNGGEKIEKYLEVTNGDFIAEIHTSCSQDILGIMFPGAVTVINYVDTEGNISDVDGCTPAVVTEPCECNGGMVSVTFEYNGTEVLTTNSGMITDNGDGTYTVTDGGDKLDSNLEISDGTNIAEIHTSCSDDILGVTFAGDITVTAFMDDDGNIGSVEGCIPAPEPCECNGGMVSVTFEYPGDGSSLTTNSGIITDNGDGTYTVTDGGEKLDGNLEISDGTNIAEIHTSCSDDILGVTFAGDITVTAFMDDDGNIGSVEGCIPAPEPCECNGGIVALTFTYYGTGELSTNSGTLFDNGDGTYTVTDGGEKLDGNLEISDGTNIAEIHTSCSDDILGVTFAGGVTVIAHTDNYGNVCSVPSDDDGGVKRSDSDPVDEEEDILSSGDIDIDSIVEFDVKAWPVPSKSHFNLKIMTMNTTDKVEISVVDISNKLIHVDNFIWDQTYKFGEKLPAGVYFVRIVQGANIKVIRVMKR